MKIGDYGVFWCPECDARWADEIPSGDDWIACRACDPQQSVGLPPMLICLLEPVSHLPARV